MTQHPAPDLWQHLVQWQPATAAAITQHIRALPDDWPQRVFGVGRPDAALTLPPAAIGEQYPDQTPEIAPYDDVANPESCPACTEAGGNCRWHEGFAQGHHDRVQAQIDAMKLRPDMPLREYALWEAEVSEALDNGQTPPVLPAAPSVPADTDRRDRIAVAMARMAGHWELMADHDAASVGHFEGPTAATLNIEVAERGNTYRQAAADVHEVLRTGCFPHVWLTGGENAASPPVHQPEAEQVCADCKRKDREFATCERLLREAYEETTRLRATTLPTPTDESNLAPMFEGLERLIATSSRDWGTYRVDAWLYAVLVGWDCEQTEHDETCVHGAMEEMAEQHGWDADAVAKARRYRAAVRRITGETQTADGPTAPSDSVARDRIRVTILPSAPTDRAAVLREEAASIRAHCPEHLDSNSASGAWMVCHCAVADDIERRMAAEARQTDTAGEGR